MYSTWWALVADAASARAQDGSYSYGVTDLASAASDISRTVGGQYAKPSLPGLSQLFGIARTMERAADTLTAAPDTAPITSSMVAEPPWSRSADVMATTPQWQARAEVTYLTTEGVQLSTWITGVFSNVLPLTVGDMNAELLLQARRMLSQANKRYEPAQQILDVGRTYLLAV